MNPDEHIEKPLLSTKRLLVLATLLVLLSLLVAGIPSVRFFIRTFEETMYTTAKFDANTQTVIDLPDDRTRYILAAVVASSEDQPPATELTLRTPEGVDVEYWDANGWMSKFGDHYRRVYQFRSPESGTVVLTATSDPREDFAILRHPEDVFRVNSAAARPWWIAGAIIFFSGIAVIVFVIFRKGLQKDDLRLSI
ncbi:MAG: hypothetical protein KC996_11850 [Phycisphaerales bacterium]|nr:hypothetical protein [Phycisphaerales bacterium]